MIKNLLSVFKYFISEVFIIFCFIFLINSYIGNVDVTINADGIGYYDYLPSIFIHHDILRKDIPLKAETSIYNRINSNGNYVNYNSFKVDKYPCGTALLQLPFFSYTLYKTSLEGNFNDGYQKPFQKAIFYAAVFYLFMSILFLKALLKLYKVNNYIIIFCQFLLVLGTSVTHYANYDSGFSHVYSLFAITAFMYFMKSYLHQHKLNHFVISCLFLGLICILRQPNMLIIFFIPFLAGSFKNLKNSFNTLLTNKKSLIIGIVLFFTMASIQAVLWYMQTGKFIVYSYQGESFNFLDPYFISILFSYKKGLFIYTPVLLIALFSAFWLAFKRNFFMFTTWMCFFVLLTYVLSSWWSWYYGCSYGLRAYVDYYAIFFIPFALMLNQINLVPRLVIMILAVATIPLNIIQTFQYKEYILHWIDMDKEKYWKVFLKTEDRYKGLMFKRNVDDNQYATVHEISISDICSPKNTNAILCKISSSKIPNFDKVDLIQVLFENDFLENSNTKLLLSINRVSDNYNYYWDSRYMIQFHENKLNVWQTGLFNFEFNPIIDSEELNISLDINTGSQNDYLKNVRMKFMSKALVH
jgi:hypothetical protein